ncbi:hypothetical protein HS125_02255 [bacterium]|nr:hypothetical protein [bacterium]
MTLYEVFLGWMVVFFTLAIFSFLYKDNPIYKFAEHVYLGAAVGYGVVIVYAQVLEPDLVMPIVDFLRHLWGGPTAVYGEQYEVSPGWRLVALALSIMIWARLTKRFNWWSRWALAMIVGAYAALRLVGDAQAYLVAKINATLLPLWPMPGNPLLDADGGIRWVSVEGPSLLTNWLIVLGVAAVLIHFFFSVEHKGPMKGASRFGIMILMITFGSSFGYTVLARVSLLIGRVVDLQERATGDYFYATYIIGAAMITYFVGVKLYERAAGKA